MKAGYDFDVDSLARTDSLIDGSVCFLNRDLSHLCERQKLKEKHPGLQLPRVTGHYVANMHCVEEAWLKQNQMTRTCTVGHLGFTTEFLDLAVAMSFFPIDMLSKVRGATGTQQSLAHPLLSTLISPGF